MALRSQLPQKKKVKPQMLQRKKKMSKEQRVRKQVKKSILHQLMLVTTALMQMQKPLQLKPSWKMEQLLKVLLWEVLLLL